MTEQHLHPQSFLLRVVSQPPSPVRVRRDDLEIGWDREQNILTENLCPNTRFLRDHHHRLLLKAIWLIVCKIGWDKSQPSKYCPPGL